MTDDRLRHNRDDIKNLGDLIEARDEYTSHLARDVDAFDKDFNIPEDIDVDDALTFPHPKHKRRPTEGIDLMGTPREEDIDIDWRDSQVDMLPSDYGEDYSDVLTTNIEDREVVAEEAAHHIAHVGARDLIYETPIITALPEGFKPGEVAGEEPERPIPAAEQRDPARRAGRRRVPYDEEADGAVG